MTLLAEKRVAHWQHDRVFYTGMSLAVLVTVFIGFAPTYYLKGYFQDAPLRPLVHVHGLVFTSWILLFLTQTALIAGRRTPLHRKLGVAGAVLAALVVVVGTATAITSARRGVATGDQGALSFLAIPLGDMLVFGALAAAGIRYRRQPEVHKRLMLVATISMLPAALARWPLALLQGSPLGFFAATDLFIVAAAMYDFTYRRHVHAAYLWGALLVVASQPLRLALSGTQAWIAIASALVR